MKGGKKGHYGKFVSTSRPLQPVAKDSAMKAQTMEDYAHERSHILWTIIQDAVILLINFIFNKKSKCPQRAHLHVQNQSKKSKRSNDSHSSAKLLKIMLVMSFDCTPVTQSLLCLISLMCVAPLNYSGQASKNSL